MTTSNICGFCGDSYAPSLLSFMHGCAPQKKAAAATAESAEAQRKSAASATIAMKAIQNAVLDVLDGQFLKGLPNLGTGSDSYRAINVRAKDQTQKFSLDRERPYLCIDRAGLLVMVTYGREEIIEELPDIESLPPVDLDAIVAGYRLAISRHMHKIEEDTAGYRRLEALASRVCEATEQAQ